MDGYRPLSEPMEKAQPIPMTQFLVFDDAISNFGASGAWFPTFAAFVFGMHRVKRNV